MLPNQASFLLFSDGASSGNPGPGGWGVAMVTAEGRVREIGGGEPATTNNRMELTATLRGLQLIADKPGSVELYTDSTYVIRGITQWIHSWRRNDWASAKARNIANLDLWGALWDEVARRGKSNPVAWRYVRGHSGVPGNERVDEIAVDFTKGRRPDFYEGLISSYPVAILNLPKDTSLPPSQSAESRSSGPAKSATYLSLVNGVLTRHATWAECESRVKGTPGARFKKVSGPDEEKATLKGWGIGD